MAPQEPAHFPTTQWTLVARLRSGDAEVARRALDELLAQYRYVLYTFIRRRGFAHEDAEDALHDFLLKMLDKHWLEDATAARGRLRGLLGATLGNFLLQWQRDSSRRAARGATEAPAGVGIRRTAGAEVADHEDRYAQERFSEEDTPERIFDRKWGHALMARVLKRLKAQCEERDKGAVFAALGPVLLGGGTLRGHDASAIAARLGMSAGNLRVTLTRFLREYRGILEDEVLQTVERREDVDEEIGYLKSLFA